MITYKEKYEQLLEPPLKKEDWEAAISIVDKWKDAWGAGVIGGSGVLERDEMTLDEQRKRG